MKEPFCINKKVQSSHPKIITDQSKQSHLTYDSSRDICYISQQNVSGLLAYSRGKPVPDFHRIPYFLSGYFIFLYEKYTPLFALCLSLIIFR